MAKKKKAPTPSFDPARFRMADEASMADVPLAMPTSIVDERTRLSAMQTPEADTPAGRFYNYFTGEYVSSPDLIKPRTGMGGAESGGGVIDTGQFQGTGKTITSVTYEGTGKNRIKVTKYSDGTESREPAPEGNDTGGKTIVSTYTDPNTGDVIAVYSDNTTAVLSKGTKVADAAKAQAAADAAAKANRQSAYDLLFQQFDAYGLGALVTPLKGLIESGISPAEFTIKLRETDAYRKRFAANQARIGKGLRALSEAEYIGLEDQYQDVMRRYGLPDTYYTRGDMGRQEGFEKFIGGDVSPVELEDRIQTAQRRVINAAPQIKDALTQYYGNEISNGDILAYVLDPDKAIENIKRKVTAAEIGGAAAMAGLGAGRSRAEELGAFGVTGERARQGFNVISEFLPQARVLGERYAKQGLGDYTQETAEQEVFAIPGSAEAGRKRRKLAELEQAQFSGSTGLTGGALGRERAGQF
jgi:hypothetical protein